MVSSRGRPSSSKSSKLFNNVYIGHDDDDDDEDDALFLRGLIIIVLTCTEKRDQNSQRRV